MDTMSTGELDNDLNDSFEHFMSQNDGNMSGEVPNTSFEQAGSRDKMARSYSDVANENIGARFAADKTNTDNIPELPAVKPIFIKESDLF